MADRSGQQLGNYRIIRLLGRGGFADVYLGEHIYLHTPDAVKLLHTQLTNDDMEGFLKEARTIAHLMHPHIVRVTDFGVDGETPFLVMDYAPNGTLRQRHPKGSILPPTTIIPYVKQIADALQHAHDEKLIHRDIKPENMLLGRRNEVLLSDFGIALMAQSSRYQSTQDVVGTVAYMSPEQIQGKPRPASDQYSLGVVVYEWLCGDRPFHGSFTELCTQHMFAPPPPLREKVSTIPPSVELVLSIALAKDPKQRFASVQAFANALEQASQIDKAPIVVPQPPSPPPPTPTPVPELVIPPTQPVAESARASAVEKVKARNTDMRQIVKLALSDVVGKRDEKTKAWSTSKYQVAAIISGAVLFGVLNHLLIFVGNPGDPLKYGFILPAIVICLFFGAVYGPQAGVFSGAAGYIISYLLDKFNNYPYWFLSNNWIKLYYDVTQQYSTNSDLCGSSPYFCIPDYIQDFDTGAGYPYYYGHLHYYGDFYWQALLSYALLGFIIGLAFFLTRRHYNTIRNIVISTIIGVIATVVSLTLADAFYDRSTVSLSFIYITLPTALFALILLPILLFVYNKIAERIKHS